MYHLTDFVASITSR